MDWDISQFFYPLWHFINKLSFHYNCKFVLNVYLYRHNETKTVINFVYKPTQSHNQILLKRLSIVVLCKVDYRLLGKKREWFKVIKSFLYLRFTYLLHTWVTCLQGAIYNCHTLHNTIVSSWRFSINRND